MQHLQIGIRQGRISIFVYRLPSLPELDIPEQCGKSGYLFQTEHFVFIHTKMFGYPSIGAAKFMQFFNNRAH